MTDNNASTPAMRSSASLPRICPSVLESGPVSGGSTPVGMDETAKAVELEGQENPLNWSAMSKWVYTVTVVGIAAIVGFTASVQTPSLDPIARHFHTSTQLSTFGSSAFLIGSAFGPLIFAPLSELWGRNPLYYSTCLLFCLANVGCALAPNIVAFLLFRFIAGLFGVSAVANSGGTITDLWPQSHRSVPFALYTAACFCGPVLGPIVGGFLTQYASWQWNFWVVVIVSGAFYAVLVVSLPETYATTLIEKKAIKAGAGLSHGPRASRFTQSLMRPWVMLFTEPILFSLSLYMAFIYGVLFLDFTAYPIVFENTRKWSTGVSRLSLLGIGIGMAVATALSPLVNRVHTHYVGKLGPVPEARLPHLVIISWLLPIGIFWFGWTALPPTPWIVSILAGLPFGFALVMLFLGINGYLTDCYDRFGASALAANTMLRSSFGAGFAMFATDMYKKLGTPWATSTLGFIALALGILPLLFYRYGATLRAMSNFHTNLVKPVATKKEVVEKTAVEI